jgi:hypothetical protein
MRPRCAQGLRRARRAVVVVGVVIATKISAKQIAQADSPVFVIVAVVIVIVLFPFLGLTSPLDTHVAFVAHAIEVAIVDNDFARDHVNLVANALKVSAVLFEYVRHGGLKLVVGVCALHREPVVGIPSDDNLLGLVGELVIVGVFSIGLDELPPLGRRLHG